MEGYFSGLVNSNWVFKKIERGGLIIQGPPLSFAPIPHNTNDEVALV